MSFIDVLQACRSDGIRFAVRDGKLLVAGGGEKLTPHRREQLGRHKAEIIAFLSGEHSTAPGAIGRQPEREAYPLSFSQQRLWFIDQLEGGSSQYNIPAAFRARGPLNVDAVQRALDAIVARHAVLRTVFELRDGEPAQVVRAHLALPVAQVDLSALDEQARDAEVARLVSAEAARPFDLSHDAMLRCALLRLDDQAHVVLFTLHHIAADGWSQGVLVREFMALYASYNEGGGDPLPPLEIQYHDFACWQRDETEGGALATQLQYWQTQLDGLPVLHGLPLDHARPAHQGFQARQHGLRLDSATLQALQQLARSRGATLFMVLQSAFAAILGRYSGESDIVIGVPNAGRSRKEVAPLIGFFINTLVFRSRIASDMTVEELIDAGKQTALDAFSHSDIPFDLLNDTLKHERNLAYNPLCQIKFVLQNHDAGELALPGLELEALGGGAEQVHFDLDLTALESEQGLYLGWTYKQDLFDAVSIGRMAAAYERLLRQMVARPEARLDALEWLDAADVQQLRSLGSGPLSQSHRDTALVRQIEAQAARTPDAIALRCGDRSLSYAGFEAKANRLANALIEMGVAPGARVGVHLERSVELLVALHAVMKTGAAYVPLDHRQPGERLKAIVADAGIDVVLLDSRRSTLPVAGLDTVYLDDAGSDDGWLAEYPAQPPAIDLGDDDSVYVLYTSGSTGTPKGVEIRHGGLTDYCAFALEGYYTGDLDGSLVVTSPAFDLTVPSLYVPLLAGGCVELMPAEDELAALATRMEQSDAPASLLRMTPSHVQSLLALLDDTARPQAHVFVIGGEAFTVELARELQAKYPQSRIYNHYGPTEAVVGCSWFDVSAHLPTLARSIPVGRPMSNTTLYVMDAAGQLQPPGVAGELYIGGAGVAKGYLNRPELTAQKFVDDPYAPGQRLYRSGDRVRWRVDGNLEFLGRLDDQVKLRGFRIELGDIASVIRGCAGVTDAVAVVRGEHADARLVAYVVGEGGDGLLDRVKQTVTQQLPAYMHPSAYVSLERLPLTPNGKVDRKALPAPEQQVIAFEAPATATEIALAAIWSRLLKHDAIGRRADFFELGGHSLLATRVVSDIARTLGKPLPVRAVFEHSTLQQLAAHLDAQTQQGHVAIPVVGRDGPLPLSFAQQRLWFIDRLEGGSAQYNMPVALKLSGRLDTQALQQALDALVERHEVLRTTYAEIDGAAVQRVLPAASVPIVRHDLAGLDPAQREQRVQALAQADAAQAFDLQRDRMLRCALAKLDETEHALLFTMHHIASDGWSFGVLIREFVGLYAAFAAGQAPSLPALPIQYADYASWQRQRLQGAALQQHLDYWRQQLSGLPAVHSLPLDKPRPAQQRFEGRAHQQVLDERQSHAIQSFCRAHNVTTFVFLQTVLAMVLGRFSRETDIVMGTPTAGRLHPDVEPLIGLFINTLVLRTDLDGNPTFLDLLQRNRAMVLDAHSHQEIPFETLVDELKPTRSLSYNPLTQILINSFESTEEAPAPLQELRISQFGAESSEDLSKAELTLYARSAGDRMVLKWSYRTSLFEHATIVRLAETLLTLIEQVLAAPAARILDYALLTSAAQSAQLDRSRPQLADYDPRCVHQRIAAVATADPLRRALQHDGREVSYSELDARARALARRLVQAGVGRGDIVGVLAERGIEYAIAVVAVLNAGAAYLPLAVDIPDDRIQYMLRDSGARVLLAQRDLVARGGAVERVFMLDEINDGIESVDGTALPQVTADDASHVLYTSGSTGEPKGAVGTHGSLVNRAAWMHERFPFQADEVCCLITSTAFVRSVWELLVPLAAGQSIVVMDASVVLDPTDFCHQLERHGVTRIVTAPSLARALIELPEANERLSGLRYWFVSGEPLKPDVARRMREVLPATTLCNLYGSTETMSDVAYHVIDEAPARPLVPIGKAIANSALLVLDDKLRPVPVGVPGEICVAGRNLARGYHRREALTAEKFVPHQLGEAFGARLYRTGDLGRVLDNGDIECLGRLDYQVKLRGFRIELGEVETRLLRSPRIHDAVVMLSGEADDARLVAYLVPEPGQDGDWLAAMRSEMRQWLPDYMQPSAYVVLDAFPLTANGKVNRRALPTPQFQSGGEFVAPQGPTEAAIAAIWQDLLKVERVSATANFFELGGHSLLAMRTISEISRVLDKPVSIRALFEHGVLRELAAHVDGKAASAHAPIPHADRDMPLPLSFAQQRLWFVDRLQGGSAQYNMPFALRLSGQLDRDALRQSLEAIVARHEVLRTVYADSDNGPVQQVRAAAALTLHDEDISTLETSARESRLLQLARSEAVALFDVGEDPMLRCRLVRLADDEHALLLTVHHIASDGWSQGVLVREFVALYTAFTTGGDAQLPSLPVQYADYARWQRDRLQGAALRSQLDYWRAQLADVPGVHGLPLDRPRPLQQAFEGERIQQHLDAGTLAGLKALALRHDASLFMVLEAAFAALLARWSGEHDIVVGTPIAGRLHKDVEPMIGLFVNTLVIRNDLSGDPDFETLLRGVKATALAAYEHQEVSFEMLVEELNPPRSLSHAPLFQVLFAMQNNEQAELSLPGLRLSALTDGHEQARVDLQLAATETGDGLRLAWLFARSLFDRASIERMGEAFGRLLRAIVAAPGTPVALLPLVEHDPTYGMAAVAPAGQPVPALAHRAFEQHAAHRPDAIAVVFAGDRISYGELNARANRIAHALIALGVRPDDRVALCVDRGFDMVVGVLGILKAGAAYVALDPAYPADRIAHMLADSQPCALLAQQPLRSSHPALAAGTVPCLDFADGRLAGQPVHDPVVPGLAPHHLAYVIYTSGSTGTPKGVLLEHAGLANLAANQRELFALTPDSRVLAFASLSFDGATWEWLMALSHGASLHVCSQDDRQSPERLSALLRSNRITHAAIPPALLAQVDVRDDYALQALIVAGEACEQQLAWSWAGRCRIYNSYGPSEATVAATHAEIRAGEPITLGRALENVEVLVLSPQGQLQPVGVDGELCIGGVGLARGYLNRPELTAERFIAHPLHAGQRLYRSGDRVRRLADGSLLFLGRYDDQVKIRGFRVELGEVEQRLAQCAGVIEAVAIVREDVPGDRRLVAYLACTADTLADEAAAVRGWRAQLKQTLPEYMLPSAYALLASLPLTANGKIDKRRLLPPELAADADFAAPQGRFELALADIWQRLLGVARVGRDDSFFELGGHSLLATRVVTEVASRLDRKVPVRALFEMPVLSAFAGHVASLEARVQQAIAPADRNRPLPLSFAQQRLWFIDRLDGGSAQYNMPMALRLRGQLDRSALQRAIDALLARHEVLRTVFVELDGEAVQVVQPHAGLTVQHHDLRGLQSVAQDQALLALVRADAGTAFDLGRDPMLRCALVELGDDEHALLLTVHHIASDGWSQGILSREFVGLYEAFSAGREPQLPGLAIQYGDYAAWQRQRLQGEALQQHLDYWRQQLADAPTVHGLPLDRPRPAKQRFEGRRVEQAIDNTVTAPLKALALRHDASLFMALQAAFAALLSRWSGETDIVIGTPVAGRVHQDLEPLVGFFINTLALRSDLSGDPDFLTLLRQSRAVALAAYEHQDIPFDMLVEELRPVRSLNHAPIFQVSFSFHNLDHVEMPLSGIAVSGVRNDADAARFDIELHIGETDDGLQVSWLYATSLFDHATIERLAGSFATLLKGIVAAPEQPVNALPLLPAAEQGRIAQWSATPRIERPALCAHELFEAQVLRDPDAVAAVFDGETLRYGDLNRQANRVARHLFQQGVGPETMVGLCVERSLDMVVGVLGILKAGAAYLPLDPTYPEERIAEMLDDSGVEHVLTQSAVLEALGCLGEKTVLPLDASMREALLSGYADDNLAVADIGLTPSNLAYVIYTSGSTGKPKGVLLEHRGLINLAAWQQRELALTPHSRVLAFASMSFDAAAWEWLMALANGASLYICDQDQRQSVTRLGDLLVAARITHATLPPALLAHMELERDYSLQALVLAGEACEERLAWRWAERYRVCNAYGPSENTVAATCADIASGRPITLGKPIANVDTLVLNAAGQVQPVGVPGELYLGGHGLARGYLNRPELTAERFLAHPARPGDTLYRTGDLACWLANGELQFLGRADDQVKIRGFRVELGEIENQLARHAQVKEVTVMAREDEPGNKRLVAYVVCVDAESEPNEVVLAQQWRAHLRQLLPDYMVPVAFVVVGQLPLTSNGKIDKRRLPPPDYSSQQLHLPPQGETEILLARLWAEMLGLERVGRNDNFFELGGHSLLAIKLMAQCQDRFGKAIDVGSLFKHPTLADLAARIETWGEQVEGWSPLVPLDDTPGVPALYCVPGAGLMASTYQPLAAALRGRLSVKLLEPRGYDGTHPPCTRMDEIVDCNLQALLAHDPDGPYLLAGHSFGGAVAFEMARELRNRGRQVRLVLLDSILYLLPEQRASAHTATDYLRGLLLAGEGGDAGMPGPVPRADFERRLRSAGYLPASGSAALDRLLAVMDAQIAIFAEYRPSGRFDGPVGVLLAREGGAARLPRATLLAHYHVYCDQCVEIADVDGGHVSMLAQANLDLLVDPLLERTVVNKEMS